MEKTDKLYLDLYGIKDSEVWISQVDGSKDYVNEKKDYQAESGKYTALELAYGQKLYVTAWGTSSSSGSFTLEAWVKAQKSAEKKTDNGDGGGGEEKSEAPKQPVFVKDAKVKPTDSGGNPY